MPALIVEPAAALPVSDAASEALVDSILQKVHEANAKGPKEAAIFREYLWFAKPDKPFARTDKSTVKRRETLLLYEEEIRDWYRQIEEGGSASVDIDLTSVDTIAQGIHELFISVQVPGARSLPRDANFLLAGVDSLLAATIANSLRFILAKEAGGKKGTTPTLTSRFVFYNPRIQKLAEAFYELLQDPTGSSSHSGENQQVQDILSKYGAGLPEPAVHAATEVGSTEDLTVVLTGSTGSLGSYILDNIIRRCPRVKKVYCLNRSANARERQTAASEQRGLARDWAARHVEFLHCDLSKPFLGLNKDVYQSLLTEATDIIRMYSRKLCSLVKIVLPTNDILMTSDNQWPVNFNWDISSFEPSIAGVRHLIDFALASKNKATLSYVSTVAVVHGLQLHGAAPEVLRHVPLPAVDGYVTSKHISEMLIERATCHSGLRASIFRIGQVAGPVGVEYKQGMWPKHEWFPSVR